MTKLAILTNKEQRAFDLPPNFYKIDRNRYFSVSSDIRRLHFNKLRTNVNKVGFILQLGYFRASGKFFVAENFRKRDIQYVCKLLEINSEIDFKTYSRTSRKHHRDIIMSLSGWVFPEKTHEDQLTSQAQWYIEQQLSPRKVLQALIEHCWTNKLIIPTYNKLSGYVTDHFNKFEERLLAIVEREITIEQDVALQALFHSKDNGQLTRPPITVLKSINQSVKAKEIQKSVDVFEWVKDYHTKFKSLIDKLKLTDQATEYFATWVKKAQTFQLNTFSNKNKAYLYILAYLDHQVKIRQDAHIDIFLKSVLAARSNLTKQLQKLEEKEQSRRNGAIKAVSKSNKGLTQFREQVITIVTQTPLTQSEVIRRLEKLIEESLKSYDEKEQDRIRELEAFLADLTGKARYFDLLESLSIRLQRKVSNILKTLEFSEQSTNKELLEAISYYKTKKGDIGHHPPLTFLTCEEAEVVASGEEFRISLYKALLFFHITDNIKSGQLIFNGTYKYKGIFDYLIKEKFWLENRDKLLRAAGLEEFSDVSIVMEKLRKKLRQKYQKVNARIAAGDNPYFQLDSDNKPKLKTPKIDNSDFGFVGDTLIRNGYIPIQKILADVDHVCNFKSKFTHFSNKHKKMKPSITLLLAGILGKGCNLGLDKIANISVGISEDMLNNTDLVKLFSTTQLRGFL